jgi:hypothetical protein
MTAEARKGLLLRMPVDLHAELVRRAAEQGVSLNQLLVALLAGAVGFSLKSKDRRARAEALAASIESTLGDDETAEAWAAEARSLGR